jgi:hypothetical protein
MGPAFETPAKECQAKTVPQKIAIVFMLAFGLNILMIPLVIVMSLIFLD